MFKDNEILQHTQNTQSSIAKIGLAIDRLNDTLEALKAQVEYLAAAEEARSTHSKKPTRKAKVEEVVINEAV